MDSHEDEGKQFDCVKASSQVPPERAELSSQTNEDSSSEDIRPSEITETGLDAVTSPPTTSNDLHVGQKIIPVVTSDVSLSEPQVSEDAFADATSGESGDTEGPDSQSSSETEGPDSDHVVSDEADAPNTQSCAIASEGSDFVASRSVSEGSAIKELSTPSMTSYVALDLQEKLQQAVPAHGGGAMVGVVRRQSPTDLPPIDPRSLLDLEVSASKLCRSTDKMLDELKKTLHRMSAISVGCMQIYRGCVEKTCDEVDANIKTMYAYMAKVEEVTQSFQPVVELADQLNNIKRVLERFERQVGITPPL